MLADRKPKGVNQMPTSYLINIYNFIKFNPNITLEAEELKPRGQVAMQMELVTWKANWVT